MGANRNCLRAAVVACTAAICLSGAAGAQSPSSKRDEARGAPGATGASGAAGAIVQYQETRGTGIVYLEETGGMVSASATPVKATRVEAAPAEPAREAQAVVERAPAKVARRRLAPSDGGIGKP